MAQARSTYEDIRQSLAYEQCQSPERLAQLPTIRLGEVLAGVLKAAIIGFLPASIAAAFAWTLTSSPGSDSADTTLWIVAGALSLFGVLVTTTVGITAFRRYSRFHDAPVEATPAVLIGKHQKLTGTVQKRYGPDISNHVTLELEDGERVEYELFQKDAFAYLREGDAGVAFTRMHYLLDFDEVTRE